MSMDGSLEMNAGTGRGRLDDKVVLITGAGSGLGQSSALRFAEEGALVACVDVTEDAAATTADKIVSAGGTALALGADVSVPRDAERMVSATIATYGRVDVVFANAGISGPGNAMDLEEDAWIASSTSTSRVSGCHRSTHCATWLRAEAAPSSTPPASAASWESRASSPTPRSRAA